MEIQTPIQRFKARIPFILRTYIHGVIFVLLQLAMLVLINNVAPIFGLLSIIIILFTLYMMIMLIGILNPILGLRLWRVECKRGPRTIFGMGVILLVFVIIMTIASNAVLIFLTPLSVYGLVIPILVYFAGLPWFYGLVSREMALEYDVLIPTDEEIIEKRLPMRRPWHLRFASIGSFLLLALMVYVGFELLISFLVTYAGTIISLTNLQMENTLLLVRATGYLLVLIFFLISRINIGPYQKRISDGTFLMLKVAIVYIIFVAMNVGIGILTVFFLALWNPKFAEHWNARYLKVYRFTIVGVLGTWLLVESFFTEGWVGVTILPRYLTRSFSEMSLVLSDGGTTFFSFPLVVVLPVLMLILWTLVPRILYALWDYRKNIERFWLEFVKEPMGVVGLFIIGAIILMGVFAPYIATHDWMEGSWNLEDLLAPPSPEHWMGTNHIGQDIFSRIVYGAQISLLVGFTAAIIAVVIGTSTGLVSGYFGGAVDTLLMRITDLTLSLPTLPLMMIALGLFGQGYQNVIIVIAILSWPGTARMVRSEALSLRERPLTEAAHALGAGDTYILFKHIFPNTLPLVLANVILGVVNAILSEAGIAFLGFVPIHGQPSWGVILHWASKSGALLNNLWWWIVPPGLLIMLTTLGFVFVSHAADKVVNPRLRGRGG